MKRSPFPKTLDRQIDSFISALKTYNENRPRPRREKDYEYLRAFFKAFVRDQNVRADEILSPEYQEAISFALSQFPAKTMLNLCIDGRVLPILIFGSSAIIGSSVRVPGGMLRDFIRGTEGNLKLRAKSYYAELLDHAFSRFETDVIVEVYDSHIGCAARLVEEQAKGRNPQDIGLLADVSHKKQITDAVRKYCEETYGNSKRVIPIQTSFDPHSGFLYMGLETELSMTYAKKQRKGYSHEVLDELVAQGKIISTEQLVNNIVIRKAFDQAFFSLDWQNEYVKSAERFWKGIKSFKVSLSHEILPQLLKVYPHLSGKDEETSLEREERLFLLIANAYSGYLLNHVSKKEAEASIPHEHVSHYPYTSHEEEGIDVSEGVYPPSAISMFAVFSLDEKNLLANIELSASLVRKNRLEGRVSDTQKLFEDAQQFAEASVPVVVQEIVRDSLPDKEWEELESISWDDLPEKWDEMSDVEFLDYLHKKKNMHAGVVIAINNLRHRMGVLYDPEIPSSSHLVEHYKVALPLILGRFRKNHFIVPFVKLGFS